jgi:GxxExxY protein
MQDIMKLCDVVRQTDYDIHLCHAHGHLEKVYENALVHRLAKLGLRVKQQERLTVRDEDGTVIGAFVADLFVEDCLIVELKATKSIEEEHIAQILGYLRASRVEHGLLINFGSARFQIKKHVLTDPRKGGRMAGVGMVFTNLLFSVVSFASFRG